MRKKAQLSLEYLLPIGKTKGHGGKRWGQLSLEYLLLLAAFLCVFAAVLPLLNSVFELSLFGLDSVNAKNFSSSMQSAVAQMSFQADGAAATIEASPLLPWRISSAGQNLFVSVQGKGGREKGFAVFFPNELGAQDALVEGKRAFFLRKASGKILLEYD